MCISVISIPVLVQICRITGDDIFTVRGIDSDDLRSRRMSRCQENFYSRIQLTVTVDRHHYVPCRCPFRNHSAARRFICLLLSLQRAGSILQFYTLHIYFFAREAVVVLAMVPMEMCTDNEIYIFRFQAVFCKSIDKDSFRDLSIYMSYPIDTAMLASNFFLFVYLMALL